MNTRLIHTALRNITRNMRRSLLSAIAIAVAAMSIVVLFSFIRGMSNDMEYNLINYYTGSVQIQHEEYRKYERFNPVHLTVAVEQTLRVLEEDDRVLSSTPRINFPASIYLDEKMNGALGMGVDFQSEKTFSDIGKVVASGRLPEAGKNEVLMGAVLARELGLAVGDQFTILSTTAARGTNAMTFTLVGLASFPVAALNTGTFWAPIDRIQYFLRMPDQASSILLKTAGSGEERQIASQLETRILQETGRSYEVASYRDINMMFGFLELAEVIYYFIGVFFFLLGSTVIINTTMMVIFERMREIGTLSALGMHGKELTRLFFLEGAFISTIGSAIGVVLGIIITLVLGKVGIDFTDALSGMDFEISSLLYPELNGPLTIFVFFYSVAIASLATLLPSRKAARIEPVEALRYI